MLQTMNNIILKSKWMSVLVILLLMFPLQVFSTNNEQQQNQASKAITLVVSGEGTTKEEATKNALRSAIEQTFGTFVSSNTEVLNDEIIKDQIVTVSSGNIESYKVLSSVNAGSMKRVNVQAVVSIGKLVSFAKSHGMKAELSGATFAMNMKMKELNRKNELIVMENLYKQMEMFANNINLFDYELTIGEPKQSTSINSQTMYEIEIAVSCTPNKNMNAFWDIYFKTINSIKLSDDEINEMEKANLKVYEYFSGYHYRYDKEKMTYYNGHPCRVYDPNARHIIYYDDYKDIALRNAYGSEYTYTKRDYIISLPFKYSFPLIESMCNFKIVDNIGSEFKIGYEKDHAFTADLFCLTPHGSDKGLFVYDKNNERFRITDFYGLPSIRNRYYHKIMDSDINYKTKVVIFMKLRYTPDDFNKLSSINLVPVSDGLQYFERY